MKAVCISCFDYYDIRMRGVIEYLKHKKYDVEYLITDFNHFSKSTYKVDYGFSKQLHVLPYKKNISLRRLISHYMFSQKIRKEMKSLEPDLIYCIVPPNSLVKQLGIYRKKHSDCKLAFDVFDCWPESFPQKPNNFLIKLVFLYWANLRDNYISNADLLISVSQSGKEELDTKFGKNAKILMPARSVGELPSYSFNIKDKISFCYLGNVNHVTDIKLGTNILRELSKNRKVELHIIGEGINKEKWINLLNDAGIHTICHGIVFDDEKKQEIFAQCDFGLNIPRAEIQATMALKAVEYMRYGLPFLNSGLGDNREMVDRECLGINVTQDNIAEVAAKLVNMKEEDIFSMHYNCTQYYQKKFIEQDYDALFQDVLV